MKKIYLLLVAISVAFTSSKAQEKIIALKANPSSIKIDKVPFQHLDVRDNRIDTSRLGTVQVGALNKLAVVRFEKPAAAALSEYISELTSGSKKEPNTLLINLKKLNIFEKTYAFNERGYIRLEMDAYIQKNDSQFAKIASVDSMYTVKAADVTKGLLSKLQEVIDSLVYEVSMADFSSTDTAKLFSIAEINSELKNRWMSLPVNSSPLNTSGVYRTFDDFLHNNVDTVNYLVVEKNNNLSYKVSRKDEINQAEEERLPKDAWGINTGTAIYIRVNKAYIPLERKNNTFYFILGSHFFLPRSFRKVTMLKCLASQT